MEDWYTKSNAPPVIRFTRAMINISLYGDLFDATEKKCKKIYGTRFFGGMTKEGQKKHKEIMESDIYVIQEFISDN
jgi:hypothetical protein